ncbi:UBact family ubiquitin protein [Armatimonas rosea]|uniref:UBact family ubiquitin protein n=1 Tax=Armatimonas rosea TaxID=685828 RepID=UPI003CCD8187
MPPNATDNAADNNEPFPPPPPAPRPTQPARQGESRLPPLVLERMKRVDPTLARRYEQRSGQ